MSGWVGILDSGIGGLTVLSKLLQQSPKCNYLYVADHAFCPYGIKPLVQIQSRVVQVSKFLKAQGATHLVLACNTASIFANEIRLATQLPVFDVVSPTCQAVKAATSTNRVALLATNATVKSKVYQRNLKRCCIKTIAFPCSPLVPLVESVTLQSDRNEAVRECLKKLGKTNADTVILGCTHFPLLQQEIAACAPNKKIVSCSDALATMFFQGNVPKGSGKLMLLTTGEASFANAASAQCGYFEFCHVCI